VYYAATLMEAQLCHGDPVAVVGGGNSAGQAALFLTSWAERVRLVVREPELTVNMSRYLADRIRRDPDIDVHLNSEVRELVGHGALEALVIEEGPTGRRERMEARALFVFIGAEPHTSWLGAGVALDTGGYILTGPDACADDEETPLMLETSLPGVFAAGDVRSGSIKRVASAVGEGSIAIRMVHERVGDRRRGRAVVHTQT
jgi:thioredoxin reductase (NADPH)